MTVSYKSHTKGQRRGRAALCLPTGWSVSHLSCRSAPHESLSPGRLVRVRRKAENFIVWAVSKKGMPSVQACRADH